MVAFMFLKSIPTSRVTPSPNRRFEAATWYNIVIRSDRDAKQEAPHLKGIFLFYYVHRGRILAHLLNGMLSMSSSTTSVARTGGMLLSSGHETEDGISRSWRRHCCRKFMSKANTKPPALEEVVECGEERG